MRRLRWRPYWSAFRLRALMESQYRAAALGGMVTQLFFALVLISLYQALYAAATRRGYGTRSPTCGFSRCCSAR